MIHKTDVSTNELGCSNEQISGALEASLSTVIRTRRQCVEEGLDAALSRKKSFWSPPRTFEGEAEAKLIALTCSEPQKDHTHWTLRLLKKCVVELGIVEAASDTTIYRVLKKNEVNLIEKYWVIPSESSAGFVAAIRATVEIYTRPRDPARPLVFLKKTSKQLTRVTRPPLPHVPVREARIDYEYERAGAANLFMHFAPLVPS